MGAGDEGRASTSQPSLLLKRERFHLAYRLAGRSFQLLVAPTSPKPGRRIVAAMVCVGGDIVGAAALQRNERFSLRSRLAMDAFDTALWSQGQTGLELATMPGVPLAMEAGLRIGLVGMTVPLVNASVTSCLRRLKGRPVAIGAFRYQAMAVAVGTGIAIYERNRRRVSLARHQQTLEARIGVAHLAGQNDIATGADTVVDLLSRTTPLLRDDSNSLGVGRILADWRQSLAASTSKDACYLGIALAKWQRRHNASQHDLAADVVFEVKDGNGTILLSADQTNWLDGVLSGLSLRGSVHVEALDIVEARQPNQPRRLRIGDATLTIPSDLHSNLVPFDVGPLGFVVSSMWFLDTLLPDGCKPNLWAVIPGIVAGPVLALWSHRQVVRRGGTAHAGILLAAVVQSITHAAASTRTMRNSRNSDGVQRFPFLGAINMLAMMVPLYWDDLEANQQMMAIIGLVSIVAVGISLFPGPIQWSHLVAELLWPAAAFYSMATMRSQLESDTERFNEELEGQDASTISSAFADGRSYVLELVSDTRYAARRSFSTVQSRLDERMRAEVERRLTEVDQRLEELSCANAS